MRRVPLSPFPFSLPTRLVAVLRDQAPEVVVEHVAGEGGLAGTGDAGDYQQPAKRHAEVEILQVVQMRLLDRKRRCRAVDRPPRVQRVLQWIGEEAAGDRGGGAHQVFGGARRDDFPAAAAGAGAEVDYVLCPADGVFVVLDHD